MGPLPDPNFFAKPLAASDQTKKILSRLTGPPPSKPDLVVSAFIIPPKLPADAPPAIEEMPGIPKLPMLARLPLLPNAPPNPVVPDMPLLLKPIGLPPNAT